MVPPRVKPDFSNLELAYSYKSDAELRVTYKVMKMVGSSFLSKVGPPLMNFALKIGFPVKGFVKRTVFHVFCGGETLEETQSRADELNAKGVKTILDYSVEGEKSDHGFDQARDEIIRTIRYGAGNDSVAFSAVKITGIAHFDLLAKAQTKTALTDAEQKSLDRGKARLDEICKIASELKQPIFIDAEETWIQNTIDAWAEEMMRKYNRSSPWVYTTTQMYRKDRLAYLKAIIQSAKDECFIAAIKVVRGAYLEKENNRAKEMGYPSPMQPDKASTDRDFDAAMSLFVENLATAALCAGTHNEKSSMLLVDLMEKHNVPVNHPHILFAQLLGMSDHISFNLAHHGYNAGKYLPYGPVKSVMPYLTRRAAENTSIAGQSSRELAMVKREMKRRKLL